MILNQTTRSGLRFLAHATAVGAAALCITACDRQPELDIPDEPKVERLVVATPHNEKICSAFEESFSEWHHREYGGYVQVWWVRAGTPQCVAYVREAGRPDFVAAGRPIPDVLFGGGPIEHQEIADRGLSRSVDLAEAEADLPAMIKGVATRDPANRWHSSALSSFGLFVARQALSQREIAEPALWADLAEPRFHGWVAMADPQRSGSNRQCLLIVLQKYGWERGWGLILRIAANCRSLADSSAEVIRNVATGNCLVGLSVNFSALREIEARGEAVLAYVLPGDGVAVTPDPVSVLTYALHPEIGERFVRFCVSDPGQILWGYKADHRGGGHDTLFRYPINPLVYAEHRDKLGVRDNPFEIAAVLPVDLALQRKQSQAIGPLLGAACGDNHVLLQRVWGKIIDAGMPAAALAELTTPIVSEAEAYESATRLGAGGADAEAVRERWSEAFRQKYERVEGMLQES